jgi:hypothetical protein
MDSARRNGEQKNDSPAFAQRPQVRRPQSKPDARDYDMASLSLPKVIPSVIDPTEWCRPVRDQGDLGACTAFAGTSDDGIPVAQIQKSGTFVFSPLYLYYQEWALDGDRDKGDTGSTGRTCVKALNQFGVCRETDDRLYNGRPRIRFADLGRASSRSWLAPQTRRNRTR